MDLKVDGKYSADYLWETEGIVPILKVDKGLLDLENGVQLMKPISDLDALLVRAKTTYFRDKNAFCHQRSQSNWDQSDC